MVCANSGMVCGNAGMVCANAGMVRAKVVNSREKHRADSNSTAFHERVIYIPGS